MDYLLMYKCVISGFILAVPIGPVNLICINRTLSEGRKSGLVVGLGAAAADAVYGYAAAAGLNVITEFVLQYEAAFRWGGGLFISYLGWKTFTSRPQQQTLTKNNPQDFYALFSAIFFLTLANPITVFTYIATFSSFDITRLISSFTQASLAALGVFLGSSFWWLVLTSIICLFQDKVTPQVLANVNKFAGIIIILIGLVSIFR